jgi:hypothetical protein
MKSFTFKDYLIVNYDYVILIFFTRVIYNYHTESGILQSSFPQRWGKQAARTPSLNWLTYSMQQRLAITFIFMLENDCPPGSCAI